MRKRRAQSVIGQIPVVDEIDRGFVGHRQRRRNAMKAARRWRPAPPGSPPAPPRPNGWARPAPHRGDVGQSRHLIIPAGAWMEMRRRFQGEPGDDLGSTLAGAKATKKEREPNFSVPKQPLRGRRGAQRFRRAMAKGYDVKTTEWSARAAAEKIDGRGGAILQQFSPSPRDAPTARKEQRPPPVRRSFQENLSYATRRSPTN